MNAERWHQVQALLAELEECPEAEREALLSERCGSDEELRQEVLSLLAASSEAASYFDGLTERAITPLETIGQTPAEPSMVGQDVAQFRVIGKLGEGGMGEVYRATDMELRRDVALKVLPERLVDDARQVARFKREAQLLASLNHPSIGAIYGLREVGGRQILILELVEGPTLAARLAAGRLPLTDTLNIAREIAVALEAAHSIGIVHRDLKPANIKLTGDEGVKVLDFGIAKAVHEEVKTKMDRSPATTDILAATHTGQVVGTVSYMSPEQLKGKSVDTRADVWAFGAVLFEMLAGKRPFDADGFAVTLANILEHPPDWDALPASTSPRLRRLLERCFERDVARRLQAIGEARIMIEDELAGVPDLGPTTGPAALTISRTGDQRPRRRLAAAVLGFAGLAAVSLAWALTRPGSSDTPVERYVSPLRAGQQPVLFGAAAFNLSSDGSVFVYRGPGETGSGNRLWVKRSEVLDAVPLRGTEGALAPAVSPDGRELAFSQGGEIKVVSLAGGPVRSVLEGINPSWGLDGYLYATVRTGTARVPPAGGDPELVTRRIEGEGNHFIIDFLPGGEGALLSLDRQGGDAEIYGVRLESGEKVPITSGTWPRFAESGHLVFLLDGSLMVARFDPDEMVLQGPIVPLLDGVLGYALSDEGRLVYSTGAGPVGTQSELVWVTRAGAITPVDEGWFFDRGGANPGWSLSPDGTRIALRVGTEVGQDIWVKDLELGTLSRLTFHEAEDRKPRWSPDGRSVTFLSSRSGDLDVWSRRSDGSGGAELLFDHPSRIADAFWGPDAEWLILRTAGTQDLAGGRDIVAVRPGMDVEATALLTADYDEAAPALSPDGRWLAYGSTETGRYEVYVRPFPEVESGRWQVTTEGGSAPVWAHNGRELFYVDGARRLVSIEYETEPGFRLVGARRLFSIPPGFDLAEVAPLYESSPDDERFLMARVYSGAPGTPRTPEIVVVRNFFEELRARAPS